MKNMSSNTKHIMRVGNEENEDFNTVGYVFNHLLNVAEDDGGTIKEDLTIINKTVEKLKSENMSEKKILLHLTN